MAKLPEGFSIVEEPEQTGSSLPEGFSVVDDTQPTLPEGFEVVEEEPSAKDIVVGVGTEVTAGIGGSLVGGVIGGAVGSVVPVVGTAAGAVAGSVVGGATASFFGSLLAQDIEGRDEPSMGRAIAAAAIGAVPGGVGKGVKGAMSVGKVAAREAAKGSAFGVTEATARAVVDEGRLPTPEELAKYGGAGALFGGALGGVTSKVGQKFAGKTPSEIDRAIARGDIDYNDVKFFAKSADDIAKEAKDAEGVGEKIIRRTMEETTVKARGEAAAEAISVPRNLGTIGKILASVAPSRFIGTKSQQATIDFTRTIKAAEEISEKIGRRVQRAIKKNPTLEAPINKFLDTGERSDALYQALDTKSKKAYDRLTGDLTKYDRFRAELQKEAVQLIDDGAYRSLDDEARERLRQIIIDTTTGNQRYARRDYKAFLDPNYKPSNKLREDAKLELRSKGMTEKAAEKHLKKLENSFASTRKEDPRRFFAGGVDSIFKRRHNPGDAEMEYLGIIKDPVERMRGTLTGIARSVARERTDMILQRELVDSGVATTNKLDGMQELVLRGTGEEGTGLYGYPQVQTALNELYVGNGSDKIDNIFLNGLQDLYRGSVGLSKGVKVLLNTVAYPVQVYGNTANLMGMGINPFAKAGRGLRLALADAPIVARLLEGVENTPGARRALLNELDDMARYGIKNGNVIDSDIRATLNDGPFSKWLQKGLDPFGRAYQVPDVVGRYVGWKANQQTIRKMFPKIKDNVLAKAKAEGREISATQAQKEADEIVKRIAASMINDTYQNYDKLSNVIRTLSRWGVMPQFASFTVEFMRNQYNQGIMLSKMIGGRFGREFADELGEANVARMRAEGTKRLASLIGVYGATYAAIEAVKIASNVDKKTESDLRDLVYAPWDKDRNQLVKLDKDGKSGWVANPSYVVPHAMGLSALKAGMRGDDEQSLVGLLADEMVGKGSFVFQEAYRALANQDERGKKISNQLDDLKNAQERMTYFIQEAFKPGFSRELKKLQDARLGKGDLTLKEWSTRQMGARINPFNVEEAAMFTVRNTQELASNAKTEYTSLLKYGEPSERELSQAYEKANGIYQEAFQALRRNYESMQNPKFGFTEDKIIETFKKGGLSSKRILEIMTNTPSDLPRTTTPSTSELYNDMGATMSEKRKNIMQLMRTDRNLGERLLKTWKRERRDKAKGLDEKDILIRNMGIDDRVDFLSRNPAMIDEFRSKGMLTDSVVRALRLKGVM